MSEQKSMSRILEGIVTSDKMNKSIVVLIERRVKHPQYLKIIKRSTKIHAHDENNEAKEGDRVVIQETRPISKTKRWKLVEIKERAK
ncbi:MAG: 30S ribosomal protein S17 [Gammaproteobacteria bacterium RIFOXYB2_FULL_38_6]|nr:MAG: 30S ribosomal protein S17 [Gammaproteobacteria bacterium RIFOXYB2_FULL_38_6]